MKSLTDYAAVDKGSLEKVTETPLDWNPPAEPSDGGSSGGCNAAAAGALAAIALISCGAFVWRRK